MIEDRKVGEEQWDTNERIVKGKGYRHNYSLARGSMGDGLAEDESRKKLMDIDEFRKRKIIRRADATNFLAFLGPKKKKGKKSIIAL